MRLQRIEGSVGSTLDDGTRATLVTIANRGVTGGSPGSPTYGPAVAGQLILAWWGTSTATATAPNAAELAIPSGWRLIGVAPVGESRLTYPSRWMWLVFVAASLDAGQAAASSWTLGQQDTRALPRADRFSQHDPHLAALTWQWWTPQAWAVELDGAKAGSILDIAWTQSRTASTVPSPPPRSLPGENAAAAFTLGADWSKGVAAGPGRFYANGHYRQQEADGSYDVSRGYDEATRVGYLPTPHSWDLLFQVAGVLTESGTPLQPVPQVVPATTVTVSLSSTANVPMTPVITSLTDGGFVDGAAGHALTWDYRPGVAGAQTAWGLSRTTNGVTEHWDATSQAWQPSEAWNLGAVAAADLPASATPNGRVTSLSMRVQAAGVASLWSMPISVTWVDVPSVSVSVLGADAGGVVVDQTPTIQTLAAPGAGAQITGWEAEVRTGSGPLVVSTSAPGVQAWTLDEPLENDATYIARARVRQSGGMWSEWASTIFTVRAVAPGAPTVTAEATVHETSHLPGLEVAVTFPDDGFPYSTTPLSIRLQRSEDGGASWETVTVVALPPGIRSALIRDWMAPPGRPAIYRARGEATDAEGAAMWGGWGLSTPVLAQVPGGWLMPVAAPERAVRVRLFEEDAREVDLRVERQAPIGSPTWVVTGDVPTDQTGSLTISAWSTAEVEAAQAILTSGDLLRLTWCPEREQDHDTRETPRALIFRVGPGSLSIARAVQGPFAIRRLTFPWTAGRLPAWKDT